LSSLRYRRRRQATNAQRRLGSGDQRAAQIHERNNYRFRARQYTRLTILEHHRRSFSLAVRIHE
jgi:hypothetical protein